MKNLFNEHTGSIEAEYIFKKTNGHTFLFGTQKIKHWGSGTEYSVIFKKITVIVFLWEYVRISMSHQI